MWIDKCEASLEEFMSSGRVESAIDVYDNANLVIDVLKGTPVKDVNITYDVKSDDAVYITVEFECGMTVCYTVTSEAVVFEKIKD